MKSHPSRFRQAGVIALAVAASAAQAQSLNLQDLGRVLGNRVLPRSAPQEPAPSDGAKTASQLAGCGLGAIGGLALAKVWAKADSSRLKLTGAQAKKREKGYMLGLALVGCGAGGALAGTAYEKLSADGKKQREQELALAAQSAKVRTYTDPTNADLAGRITPGPVYADSASRECRDIEDVLADAGKGEPLVVKYCRAIPDGGWSPAVA